MRKWFPLSVLLFFFSSCFSLNAAAKTFMDLPSSHSFYNEVMFLEAKGIISGYPDHSVRPENNVTRAEAAVMLGRALNDNSIKRSTSFADVPAEHWASGYIASALDAEIIKGYPDGTFRPNDFITRAQASIILSRAFHLTEESKIPFTDVSPSMESYPHIKRIIAENLAQGFTDNTFRPHSPITRAHFSAFLARALHDDFKVDSRVFLKDSSKVYHYDDEYEGNIRFVYSNEDDHNWRFWQVERSDGTSYEIVETQDREGYKFGYPYSEYSLAISHPIRVGHTWDGYGEMPDYYQITAVGLSMTTPAGTFENVVEVTTTDEFKRYYAPFTGMILAKKDGTTIAELVKIE